MKRVGWLLMMVLVCGTIFAQSEKSIEGAWEMVFSSGYYRGDFLTLDDLDDFRQVKVYSPAGAFLFVGEYVLNDTVFYNSGGGSYSYSQGELKEHIEFMNSNPANKGQTVMFNIFFKGDTLIQASPQRTREGGEGFYEEICQVRKMIIESIDEMRDFYRLFLNASDSIQVLENNLELMSHSPGWALSTCDGKERVWLKEGDYYKAQ